MKRILFILLFLQIFACAAFRQGIKEVPVAFTENPTNSEKEKLDKLGDKAIQTRELILKSEKIREVNAQKKTVNEKKIFLLAQEARFLAELKNLQALQGKDVSDASHKMEEINTMSARETTYGNILEKNHLVMKKQEEFLKMELTRILAEIELIKAQIAERNQKKSGVKPEDKEFVKVDEYKAYLNKTNEDYFKIKTELEQKTLEMETLQKQLDATGFKPGY